MARRSIVLTVAACSLLLVGTVGGSDFPDVSSFDSSLTGQLASSAIRIMRLEEKLNEIRSRLQQLQTTDHARGLAMGSGIPASSVF
jgi:hypothetical protein